MFRGLRGRTSTTTRPSNSEKAGKELILRQGRLALRTRRATRSLWWLPDTSNCVRDNRARGYPHASCRDNTEVRTADSARGRGRGLGKLLSLCRGGLGCLADLQGHVARTKTNANLLKKRIGRGASGKDPDKIVRNLLRF